MYENEIHDCLLLKAGQIKAALNIKHIILTVNVSLHFS